MLSILDKLRGVLRRRQNSTADLTVALGDAQRVATEARICTAVLAYAVATHLPVGRLTMDAFAARPVL